MKRVILLSVLLSVSLSCLAGVDVFNVTVTNVYQLDSDETTFEFRTDQPNTCGGVYWRVKSPSEAVANRKFSVVLMAYTTNRKFAFSNTELCEGNRSVVSWVRLE